MEAALYMAMELGASEWKLAFGVEAGEKPRLRQVAAGDPKDLMLEIEPNSASTCQSGLVW